MKLKYLIIIVFISLILICSGVLINIDNKNETNEEKTPLVSKGNEETAIDVLEKVNVLEQFFVDKFPITNINDISNQTKLNFVLYTLTNYENNTISSSLFDSTLTDFFGSDFEYVNEDIIDLFTNRVIATYDNKSKEYAFVENSEYSLSLPYQLLSFSSYQQTETTFEVHRQYLFVDISSSPYLLYSTYQDYVSKVNSIGVYDISTTNNMISASIVENYKEILPTVVYSFKNVKNKYILQSINII